MKNLYERLKEEYRDSFNDYVKVNKTTGESIIEELKRNEYVSRLSYGCVVMLQSATGAASNHTIDYQNARISALEKRVEFLEAQLEVSKQINFNK